jgi:hypothetical protein
MATGPSDAAGEETKPMLRRLRSLLLLAIAGFAKRSWIGPTRSLFACALCSVVLVGTACGGGGGSSSTRDVTRSELPLMVLPKAAFGRLPPLVSIEHPVGFQTNTQFAAGGFDPRVTRASLTRQGRLVGYALGYSRSLARLKRALGRGSGLLDVGTEVDLYRSSAGPVSRVATSVSDLRALMGKRLKGGATLEGGGRFRLHRIGNAAVGLRLKVGIGGVHIYYTDIDFRYGRLLA